MGFPAELRRLWNKEMWERKQINPVIVPTFEIKNKPKEILK